MLLVLFRVEASGRYTSTFKLTIDAKAGLPAGGWYAVAGEGSVPGVELVSKGD